MKILGFYHIFAVNDYKEVVTDQLYSLNNSGLLSKTENLTISIIGSEEDVEFVKNILNNKLNFNKFVTFRLTTNFYENFILNDLHKTAIFDGDFYCYYFHTKGVSIRESNASFYHNLDYKTVKTSCEGWRKAMEFFIFDNHDICIKELENGNDAVGMNLCTQPKLHFSGNFWWSKSDYIKNLQPITSQSDRYSAEFWIGSGKNGTFKSLSQNKSGYSVIDSDYKTIFKDEYRK